MSIRRSEIALAEFFRRKRLTALHPLFSGILSFNDSHLAQPVLAALESNMSFRLVVCDPVFLDSKLIEKDPVTVESDATKNSFHQKLIRANSLVDSQQRGIAAR